MHRFPPKLNFARRWVVALGAAFLLAAVVVLGWLVFQDQRRQMYLRNGRGALARSAVVFFSAEAIKAGRLALEALIRVLTSETGR